MAIPTTATAAQMLAEERLRWDREFYNHQRWEWESPRISGESDYYIEEIDTFTINLHWRYRGFQGAVALPRESFYQMGAQDLRRLILDQTEIHRCTSREITARNQQNIFYPVVTRREPEYTIARDNDYGTRSSIVRWTEEDLQGEFRIPDEIIYGQPELNLRQLIRERIQREIHQLRPPIHRGNTDCRAETVNRHAGDPRLIQRQIGDTFVWSDNGGITWTAEDRGQTQEASRKAEEKARALLLRFLSPPQRETFERENYFDIDVRGRGPYRLLSKRTYNVVDLRKSYVRYCAGPGGGQSGLRPLPLGDFLLAQKVMLESDPDLFFSKANKHDLYEWADLGPILGTLGTVFNTGGTVFNTGRHE
jgi:hypothetical protein